MFNWNYEDEVRIIRDTGDRTCLIWSEKQFLELTADCEGCNDWVRYTAHLLILHFQVNNRVLNIHIWAVVSYMPQSNLGT